MLTIVDLPNLSSTPRKTPTSILNPLPTLPFSILEALSKIPPHSKRPQDRGRWLSGDTAYRR